MSTDFAAAAAASGIAISTQYNSTEYWTQRYTADPEQFDWFLRYASFKHVFEKFVPDKAAAIVDVGCGNSRLVQDLQSDGYVNARGVDDCGVVIDQMRSLGGRGAYDVDDVALGGVADASLDAVVSKGTLDTVLCGEGSAANAKRAVAAWHKKLKAGGALLVVAPSGAYRAAHFSGQGAWAVDVVEVDSPEKVDGAPARHFVYCCVKK